MRFFKKLFSSGKPDQHSEEKPDFKGIYSEKAFSERYTEEDLRQNPVLLDGCIKMVESYYLEYTDVKKKATKLINHPANLDQIVSEGIGFHAHCQKYRLGDSETVAFLAYAFSDFLITHYDFKLYKDKQPELPLRGLTLKYNKAGVVLSLYPFEFSLKVLNGESGFQDLYNRISGQLQVLPGMEELLANLEKE